MDGWIIGLVAGGLVLVALMVLLGVVVKSAATTAQTAQAVLDALEEIKATTAPLADLRALDMEVLEPEQVVPDEGGAVPGDGAAERTHSGNGAGSRESGARTEEQRGTEG